MTATNAQTVQIRCVQLSPVIGAFDHNVDRIEQELVRAATDGVDLLVLPELATSGYQMTKAEARDAALPADSELFARWTELSGDRLTVAVGFCEDGGDVLYNSIALLVPERPVIVYRKLHLWNTENLIFTPGDSEPPVINAPFGKLGLLNCYDLEFPEMPRSLGLRGADVIAVPTNWPVIVRPEGERTPEVIQAMAAARASGLVIACCDRAGEERGVQWTEGTCIIGADGWLVNIEPQADRYDAEVPLVQERRQISTHNHLFKDRRPGLYGALHGGPQA